MGFFKKIKDKLFNLNTDDKKEFIANAKTKSNNSDENIDADKLLKNKTKILKAQEKLDKKEEKIRRKNLIECSIFRSFVCSTGTGEFVDAYESCG